ncbi:hypothetical protein ADM96_15615 [Burkholderia sp. ST111]|nr:hypothetical protein ADM96_15615 [Burkholderia sp. ST111]
MSNLAEQQHFSDPAAAPAVCQTVSHALQSVAQAKKAHAPQQVTLTIFEMKTYGIAKERQQLHRKLCGSAEAADLYREVMDPFTRKGKDGQPLVQNRRDGCYWWGVTVSRLAHKLGWTEDVTKYRLKVLRQRGMIATCSMRTPKNMMQVRPLVAGGAALLNGWPDAPNYEHLYCAWKTGGQARKGAQGEVHPFYSECETHPFLEGAEFTLSKSLGLVDLGLKEVGLSLHAQKQRAEPDENLETPQGKPTATLEAVSSCAELEKISEVVNQPAPPIALAPPQKDSAHAIWEREFLLAHPGGYVAFKEQDRRNLKTVAGKLPPDIPFALFVHILMGAGRWKYADKPNWTVLWEECKELDATVPMLRQVTTTERLTAIVNAIRKLDAKQAKAPVKKPITMASATSHLKKVPEPATPPIADALASAPATPPASPAICHCIGAEPQAPVALVPVVPVQLGFDLINPSPSKHRVQKEECNACFYDGLLRVDHPVEAAA